MFKKTIDFNKGFKPVLIGYAIFLALGLIFTLIFGVNLDINFKGGTRITYSYTGELDYKTTEALIEETLGKDVNVSESAGLADDSKKIVITLVGSDSLSNEAQQNLAKVLSNKYKDNTFELYDSNSVNPSVAGAFFAKSIAAVVLTGALVVLYVGIRFRKIGGVSAGITAFVALFLDIFVAFFICNIFRLPIDSNFMAVILTILGYSLNDTIVVYDRVRENKGINPKASTAELVNESLNTVKVRTIVTTTTTFLAVVMIIVIAELFGLTSLRSFAIPMAFGLISGCISSLFISAPLWVVWKDKAAAKAPKASKTKAARR
ncbi:MAG: protein translocase subunit SecF [Acutalibacteraceae bacterium]|nr:protein translocase subunit SecF [Acutalibacteraceae bacterium]